MSRFDALLGAPGTGKTTYISNALKNNKRFCLPTASTGVAALVAARNGHKNATTIHSALKFHNEISLLESIHKGSIYPRLRRISEVVDRIAIDEISMVSADLLDLLCYAINTHNSNLSNRQLGLLVIGDFGQLPAISSFDRQKPTPVFKSKNWPDFKVKILREVKRQKDKDFIDVLYKIRHGKANEVVDWVDSNIGFHNTIDYDFKGTTIFPSNKAVDSFNQHRLDKLDSKVSVNYNVTLEGHPPSFKKQINPNLILKEGCLVMVLVNNLKQGYANGSIAVVKDLKRNKVGVELLDSGKEVYIKHHTLENIPIGKTKAIGSITYMPLRLAYATTLHSSQGTTITGKLQFKLGDSFLRRLHGGLGVVLSRCTDYRNLRLIGDKESFIVSNYVDSDFLDWM